MKIALLGDTHFGIRNGYAPIHENMWKFFDEVFFPELKNRNIDTILHMGDVFHDRSNIKLSVLHDVKHRFLKRLYDENLTMHVSIGNHDTTYKTMSDVNSPELILADYDNIHVYKDPTEIMVYGELFAVIPWINKNNSEHTEKFLESNSSRYAFGHLQIEGFLMNAGIHCRDGMQPQNLSKYERVFSGHFHKQSHNKNIHYIGSPFQFDFGDAAETKGFHVLDIHSGETEFVENPYKNFYKILYDDEKPIHLDDENFDCYESAFVKIIVLNKTDESLFDKFLHRLYDVNANVRIEETIEKDDIPDPSGVSMTADTISIIRSVVKNIEDDDIDNDKLVTIMNEIYTEAQNK